MSAKRTILSSVIVVCLALIIKVYGEFEYSRVNRKASQFLAVEKFDRCVKTLSSAWIPAFIVSNKKVSEYYGLYAECFYEKAEIFLWMARTLRYYPTRIAIADYPPIAFCYSYYPEVREVVQSVCRRIGIYPDSLIRRLYAKQQTSDKRFEIQYERKGIPVFRPIAYRLNDSALAVPLFKQFDSLGKFDLDRSKDYAVSSLKKFGDNVSSRFVIANVYSAMYDLDPYNVPVDKSIEMAHSAKLHWQSVLDYFKRNPNIRSAKRSYIELTSTPFLQEKMDSGQVYSFFQNFSDSLIAQRLLPRIEYMFGSHRALDSVIAKVLNKKRDTIPSFRSDLLAIHFFRATRAWVGYNLDSADSMFDVASKTATNSVHIKDAIESNREELRKEKLEKLARTIISTGKISDIKKEEFELVFLYYVNRLLEYKLEGFQLREDLIRSRNPEEQKLASERYSRHMEITYRVIYKGVAYFLNLYVENYGPYEWRRFSYDHNIDYILNLQ